MRFCIKLVCILSLCFSSNSWARALPLSLAEAVHLGITKDRELAAISNNVEAAWGRVEQAGLRPNPSLDAGAQSGLLTGNSGARNLDLTYNQPFARGGRLREAQAVARVDIQVSTAEIANRRRLLAGDITKAFVAVLEADAQLALRGRTVESNQRLADLSVERAKVGELSNLEVNTANLELARLRQEQSSLLADRQNKLRSLQTLLGFESSEDLELKGDLDSVISQLLASTGESGAPLHRPDLGLANLEIERVEAEQRLARAEVKGDISVGATYTYDRRGSGDTDNLFGAKVSIPLPTHNKNQGRLRELRAERLRAEAEIESLKFAISAEVASARQRADQLNKLQNSYVSSVLPLEEKAQRDLRDAYERGQIPIYQVIQSQQQRIILETNALETRSAYAQALADVETATGRNLEAENLLPPEIRP